jgi:serine/threonine-protein kinase
MAGNPHVLELLEEMLDSGKAPEEVCRDCPELLSEVQQQWQQFCVIDAEVGALLPEHGTPPGADAITPVPHSAGLPQVPGYGVEGVLGRGGMGVVYKARHLALKRTVALKMLAGGHSRQAARARFKAEAEAVARLQHPNIVQIHEIGEAGGLPFFALEFVEGGSLAKRLAGRPLPPRDAAQLVGALADAMHLAHSRNLVHRDLKPANVLLTGGADTPVGQCQPKVTDFGIARQLDADSGQTQVGEVLGTPSYMAPEQAEGRAHAAGPAADVYALGAILYECLTGRPPFKGATPLETLEQVRTREPVAPSALERQVPRDLETICLKCLRKQPERRYSSARELADDLGRFVRGEPVAARPVGVAEAVRKWVWRRRAAVGLLAAVVLLVAAGGVGAWLLYQQRATARAHQGQTDREVRRILEGARILLEDGWQAADLAKLMDAKTEGSRAEDVARSGGGSAAARQEVEAFQEDASGRLGRARKNRTLLEALLDVSLPQETNPSSPDEAGRRMVLPLPSLDEQYAAAFRVWGLDVDGTAEAEVVARLGAGPDPVVQELIAGLDSWMLERRRQKRLEAQWRRLYRVADQLDRSERRRRLRALLVGGAPPRAESVAGLVGVRSPWPALWVLSPRGSAWRELLEVREALNPRTEPVLTVVLLAHAFAAVGDTAGAERVLRQAVTARPDQVVLLSALAGLLERQGPSRLEEAIGYYRAARGQRRHLGIALSKALCLRADRPAEAEELLQELVHQQPDNPAFYFCLGIAAYRQRKYGAAQTAFRKAIDRGAEYAEAYNNLGSALYEQKKLVEAAAAYRQAIDRNPDYAEAYYCLGIILADQRKYGEAEAAYRKATDLKPEYAEAYNNLGTALIGQRKYREAEAAYRKAIELQPDLAKVHNNLGHALFGQRKYGEAEAAYRKAIELQPDLALAYYNLGLALSEQGKHAEAAAAYRKAIELQPGFADAYHNLGVALYDQKKLAEAVAAYRKAIELKPDDAQPYNNLGNALADQGKLAEAEAAYRKAIQLKPDFAVAHNNLGRTLFRQGKPAEAEDAYRKAIEIQPDFGLACHNLGVALLQQARFDEAAASLKKAGAWLPAKHPARAAARRLLQHCQRQAILDARLPAILRGTEKPANAAEQMEFARLCIAKKFYVAAARFSRDALAAEPKLAEVVPAGTRYDAACAAARAGCGQGKDADKLDDKRRALWRRQARAWLRQDLTWWGQALDKGNAQTKAQVREWMRHWQTDGDLAGVRAKGALARLPDEERKQWERLWSDVDALLRRVSQTE